VKRNVPGMTLNTLDLEEGYWRTTLNSTEILQCVNKKHCLGGANITDMCADGYTGPLCAVCDSGYAAMGSGELLTCEQCTGTSIFKIFAWLIFVLVILTAALFVSFRTLLSEDSQRSVRSRSASFGKVYEKVTKYMPVVKIILSYFQVTGTLGLVYGIRFPTFFSTFTNIISGLFSLNLFVVMPLGCTMPAGHYASLLLYTIIPFVLTGVLLGIRHLSQDKHLRTKIFEVFLAMTFVILTGVSVKIFSTFACQTFDGDYGSYLKVDYSLKCDHSAERWFYWLYAGFMILVFPLGIPMLYTYLLRKKVGTQETLTDAIIRKILCRKKLGSEAGGKIDPGQAEFERTMDDKQALKQALEEREKFEEEDPGLKALSFLYGSYEPKFWWFEIFETLRKLALTGFSVFLVPGTAAQIVMSMVMCLGATRMYCRKRPFISDFHDSFAEVVQWQLFFTMFAALAIRVNLDGEMLQDKVYFDVFLTVLQFLPMLVALIMNRDEVKEEVKNDIKEGKEGLGRAFSGDGGELVQNPMQDGKQVVLGGGSLGDVEMGDVGKMASIALSDNKETERQSSKPAPTVRGSKVAKSDLRDSMIPPAPKVEGGGQKDGREEKDKL